MPSQRRLVWVSLGTLGMVVLYALACQLLFSRSLLVIHAVAPMASLILVTGVVTALGFFTEGREKRRIRSLFHHYLHADVIREITLDPSKVRLGGERREVTVLFSDIRGFSGVSELLEPEELALLINQYLTPMTNAVLDEQGYLDKYIGDAIMAIFGAPRPRDDHAELAARTVMIMLKRLENLNRGWADKPWAPIRIGLGLNCGPVSLGNFGSERRVEYTAIGDTVNLASRLEGLNKAYGTTVLVGENLYEQLRETWWLREVDLVRVKGKEIPSRIFELLGPQNETCPVDLEAFARALKAYRAAQWNLARDLIETFLKEHPDDGPACCLAERVQNLEAAGTTSDSWNGVWTMQSK